MENRKSNVKLSPENLRFIRSFQVLGFLPIRLGENESEFASFASLAQVLIVGLLLVARFFIEVVDWPIVIVFSFDSAALLLSNLQSWLMREQQKMFWKVLGEIDERIVNVLDMRCSLRQLNVRLQRIFLAFWIVYAAGSIYFPLAKFFNESFSPAFIDQLLRAITWSFLISMNQTKFLYEYSLISVRLEIIKQCLVDLRDQKVDRNVFLIRELHRDKFARNVSLHTKIAALKEIYERCWLLQGHAYSLLSLFLTFYIIGYFLHWLYFAIFHVLDDIFANKLIENLPENLSWIVLLNFGSICCFVVSQRLFNKGLRIAGLIHNIAHNSADDHKIVQSVTMFSLQIVQQPITHITTFGIFYFDRANMSGVSRNSKKRIQSNISFYSQMILLHVTLVYEVLVLSARGKFLQEHVRQLAVLNGSGSSLT